MNFDMNRNALSRALNSGRRTGWTGMANHQRMDHPLTNEELKAYAPSIFATTAHESRSTRFQPVPTMSVIDGLRKEGFMPFSAKQSNTRDETKVDFTKHMVRFRKDAGTGTYRNEGALPEIVLVNANDGTSSYQLFGGLFRVLCLNGLIVADSMIEAVRISHKGDIVHQVIDGSYRVLDNTAKAMQAQLEWADVKLAPKEAMVFAEAAHQLRFERDDNGNAQGVGAVIKADKLLEVRRVDDNKADLWTVFNRVQENVIKGGLGGFKPSGRDDAGKWHPARRMTTKAVNGIDQDVKLNKALWSLAEGMAKLKAA